MSSYTTSATSLMPVTRLFSFHHAPIRVGPSIHSQPVAGSGRQALGQQQASISGD